MKQISINEHEYPQLNLVRILGPINENLRYCILALASSFLNKMTWHEMQVNVKMSM